MLGIIVNLAVSGNLHAFPMYQAVAIAAGPPSFVRHGWVHQLANHPHNIFVFERRTSVPCPATPSDLGTVTTCETFVTNSASPTPSSPGRCRITGASSDTRLALQL